MSKLIKKKLTLKQETFCQAYVANRGNGTDAYRKAYDPKNPKANYVCVHAWELLQNGKIKERIAILQAQYLVRANITKEDVVNRILDHSDRAVELGQMNAAIKGDELLAKTTGMLSDQKKGAETQFNFQLNFGDKVNQQSTTPIEVKVDSNVNDTESATSD